MSDELVLIEKDGERIRVHPGTLQNHLHLGWTVVAQAESEHKTPDGDANKTTPVGSRKAAKSK